MFFTACIAELALKGALYGVRYYCWGGLCTSCAGALELPVSRLFTAASRRQMEGPATHHLLPPFKKKKQREDREGQTGRCGSPKLQTGWGMHFASERIWEAANRTWIIPISAVQKGQDLILPLNQSNPKLCPDVSQEFSAGLLLLASKGHVLLDHGIFGSKYALFPPTKPNVTKPSTLHPSYLTASVTGHWWPLSCS